ncbi:MAG: hypothetical protein J6W84_03795 [Bacteroidales bacterium]|nr:hypothetical protein [Bacteroidales bacterium]
MKKFIMFLLAVFTVFIAFAQKELCNPNNGIEIKGFHPQTYAAETISADANSFNIYSYPHAKKGKIHSIWTYNKESNTLDYNELTVPKDYEPVFTYRVGDKFFSTYFQTTKKAGVNLITAFIPKNGGEIEYNTRLNIKLGKDEYVEKRSAESPDGKKHAMLFYVVSKKGTVAQMRILVYDESGKEILNKIVAPEMYGETFSLNNISVTNDGEVAVLLLTGERKNWKFITTAIQLVICNSAYVESVGAPFEDGIIYHMQVCPLKNGNYFIGGYYLSPKALTTDGFFHCFVDTKTMEVSKIVAQPLSKEQIAPNKLVNITTMLNFNTQNRLIEQLEDGSIMMVGEHYGAYYVYTNNGSYYVYNFENIIYQHFDSDGELLAAPMLKKHQVFANSLGKNGVKFTDFHISVSPFVAGNDVYLLYNDSQSNFKSGDGATANAALVTAGANCTVLAKLSDSGPETKLVMLPDNKSRQVNEVLHCDGNNVYFYTSGLKQTILHHFTLP